METQPEWVGYAMTVGLLCTSMLKSIYYHCTFNHMILLGMSMKTAFIGVIYRKVLVSVSLYRASTTNDHLLRESLIDQCVIYYK